MQRTITIVGAGILGLWQAFTLARRGHTVRLIEATPKPFTDAASAYAGTLLAPECEFPPAQKNARAYARHGLKLWQDHVAAVETRGTLVVAAAGGEGELQDLAVQAENGVLVSRAEIAKLEPALGTRFQSGLYFEGEAHCATETTLHQLLDTVREAGVAITFGSPGTAQPENGITIDCRGMAARDQLPDLRGVRGERLILQSDAIALTRPVRLMHLRQPIYVVPWGSNQFMVGATTIESEDSSQVSVKSALDLLAQTYQLHPAFGEAEIVSIGVGIRPAFPDNLPRITVRQAGQHILVNGAYRHGFLLAPVLAEATADFIDQGTAHPWLRLETDGCSPANAL